METILIITKKEMLSYSNRNYIRNKVKNFKNPFFDISFNLIYNIYIYIYKDKLQITPLKFGVDWILHPKVSET